MVTSVVVAGIIWKWIYNADGLLNAGLKTLGIDGVSWLDTRGIFNAFLNFLRHPCPKAYGYPNLLSPFFNSNCDTMEGLAILLVIYLAGLQGIPKDLEEAARVDGAGRWQVIKHVTLPSLRPYTVVVCIMATIAALRTFGSICYDREDLFIEQIYYLITFIL